MRVGLIASLCIYWSVLLLLGLSFGLNPPCILAVTATVLYIVAG